MDWVVSFSFSGIQSHDWFCAYRFGRQRDRVFVESLFMLVRNTLIKFCGANGAAGGRTFFCAHELFHAWKSFVFQLYCNHFFLYECDADMDIWFSEQDGLHVPLEYVKLDQSCACKVALPVPGHLQRRAVHSLTACLFRKLPATPTASASSFPLALGNALGRGKV